MPKGACKALLSYYALLPSVWPSTQSSRSTDWAVRFVGWCNRCRCLCSATDMHPYMQRGTKASQQSFFIWSKEGTLPFLIAKLIEELREIAWGAHISWFALCICRHVWLKLFESVLHVDILALSYLLLSLMFVIMCTCSCILTLHTSFTT